MTARLLLLSALFLATTAAQAQGASCMATAGEKKLAGAAKTSFLKKCESDARAVCETNAGEKKLSGAARNSYVKKCVGDAVGQ